VEPAVADVVPSKHVVLAVLAKQRAHAAVPIKPRDGARQATPRFGLVR
jgi:hypothetical protein